MKTETSRSSPQYRNDAIFESAQRLLATPTPRKPARWKFFVGGILLGIVSGILGWQAWMRLQPANAPAVSNATAQTAATTPPSASAVPATHAAGKETTGATTDAAATATDGDPAAAAAALAAKTSDPIVFDGATFPAASSIVWIGELISENAEPVSIEFAFRPGFTADKDGVRGITRIGGAMANTLVGEIKEHVLLLRETDSVWAFARGVPSDSPLLKYGRQFAIQLADRNATELTGVWTMGTTTGAVKLTVLRVP